MAKAISVDSATALGKFGFFARSTTMQYDPAELASSTLLACISGIIASALYITSDDNDVRLFYKKHNNIMFSVYMLCTFIIWFSFLLNIRYAVLGFISMCLVRLSKKIII